MTKTLPSLLLTLLLIPVAQARVTRVVVDHRESPAYKGQTFKDAGAYERLTGRAYGELDPKDPLNAIITDLQFAPRNARGMVEYSATFQMAKPIDLTKASGLLSYLVPNRGGISLESTAALMKDFLARGDIVLASGWQGDIAPKPGTETIAVPVARKPDGSSITGQVLARFADMPAHTTTLPIIRGRLPNTATPASLDTAKATLTRRATESGQIIPIKSSDWAFADCSKVPFPGEADPAKVCLKGGFDGTSLYELVYVAKDPLVLGIGFAATRDLVAFFRYETQDNFLAGKITHAIGQGNSQSGNFLRTLVHLGFNQEESGRIVFDGINPNIAARQMALNIRFVAPGGAAGMYEPGSDGVLWWGDYADTARNHPSASLLDRCRATETCPKIVETMGSSEFYALRASPDYVGTRADRDIPLPSNVRRYYFPGVTHGGGRGGFDANAPRPATGCELPANPNPSSDTLRAVMVALVDWVAKGTPPPPSQYPRLDRGELAQPAQATLGFPVIPGAPLPDGILNPLYVYDLGREFRYNDLSGVTGIQPPPVRQVLPSLAPRVDEDGNETSGVASVLHQAPLGTYLGWNVTAQGFSKGTSCGNAGGYVPFAKTKAERLAAGDPRPSLEERYGTHEKYVAAVRTAAARLQRDRFLLREDAERLIAEAERSNVLK